MNRMVHQAWMAEGRGWWLLAALLAGVCGCDRHEDHAAQDAHVPAPVTGAHAEDGDHGHAGHVQEVTLTAEAVSRYGIVLVEAERRVLRATFVAPARVAFNAEGLSHVGTPVRGRVVEVLVREGDVVMRGDALLVVESVELGEAQAEYLQRRGAAKAGASAVELAKAAWERGKDLHERSGAVSLAEVQKREGEYLAALSVLRSVEAAATGAAQRLRLLGMSAEDVEAMAGAGQVSPRHVVTAPLGGEVIRREVTLGEMVSPEREALMVLADTRTVWVEADVPEGRLREVAVGAPAWVVLGAGPGWEGPEDGHAHAGAVSRIAASVDAGTRTARVRIEMPSRLDEWHELRPGMFVEVEVAVTARGGDEPAAQVVVPQGAVYRVEGTPTVFVPVPGEPNTFAARSVRVGRGVGGMVPVLAGLAEGESVVAAGGFILKAEMGKGEAGHGH